MHHILFSIGSFNVHTYSVFMALAVLLGLVVAGCAGRRAGLRPANITDAALVATAAGIVGARLEYVLLNLEYFHERPEMAWQVWQGGLAWHGGLLGGFLAVILYTQIKRWSFWTLADALSLGLALSLAVGWLACLFGGCAYGQLGFGFLYFNWHDIFGVTASRFAVQPLGAALSLALFAGLCASRTRLSSPGALCLLFLIVSGAIHFGLGFGRNDDTLWLGSWRVDQWLALGQMAIATGLTAQQLLLSHPRMDSRIHE